MANNRKFSSVCTVDNSLLYAACSTENDIVAVTTSLDGIGMRVFIQRDFSYGVHWRTASSPVSGMFVVTSPAVGGNSLQVRGRGSDILFSDPTNNKIYKYIIQYDMLEVFVAG